MLISNSLKITLGSAFLYNEFKNKKNFVKMEDKSALSWSAICLLFPEENLDIHGIVSFH